MCWALSEGPLRAPPPAPRTGALRPPHMGRGMGRPARPGPGHGPGRAGPVWGMGQAYINIYRHRFGHQSGLEQSSRKKSAAVLRRISARFFSAFSQIEEKR